MNNGLPDGWDVVTLSNVSGLITKGATPTTYGFPYLSAEDKSKVFFLRGNNASLNGIFINKDTKYISLDAHNYLSRSILKADDCIISIVGSIGASFIVKKAILPANINQNVALIRPLPDKIKTKFLAYLIQYTIQKQIAIEITIQAQPSLSLKQVRDFEIPLPPLPEQQKIAKILTSVDEVIETTETQINKLKDLKKGMMDELLTKGIGHTEFKDSAVGRIPVGWEVSSLGQVGKWSGGGTPSKSNILFWVGKIPWVSPKDMKCEKIFRTKDYREPRKTSSEK